MSDDSVNHLTEGYFKWRCRRGMKELDFILNRFVDAEYTVLTAVDLTLFDQLLDEEDMLLWYWLSGKQKPQNEHRDYANLVERICAAGYHK
ncbi:succinate dehydrogenase assembly factor 2 [Marinicella sp. S1101]|uniref:FAD assembly factor SdhE n=1 Tax=Marinicella marina TaxID=2996016 RepID=UPI00226101B6|nr:succinate dehydrogenase assembly factor 2 [Marinicella marina]MCX7554463.1 succinate dehydrogenase assembly factor 2 [Marinicella marina]MDJ1140614.1 succinate dehydrogenase assembly factor 2 [Marinicella marina]